jgi:opacity protein-like surface antigen
VKAIFLTLPMVLFTSLAHGQSLRGMPSLPQGAGIQGSFGIGFTDIRTLTPNADIKFDRGTFISTSLERGFDFLHLYLTLGLSYMDAAGVANYSYTNLSSSTSYSLSDVPFRAKTYQLSLGFKLKLIDDHWFRPYIEGGGLGNYNEVIYGSEINALSATGDDYKRKDIIMGSGYYAEAGVEIQFSDRFGVKLAGRQSVVQTKTLETLDGRTMRLQSETYYLSALFGF